MVPSTGRGAAVMTRPDNPLHLAVCNAALTMLWFGGKHVHDVPKGA